MEWNSSRIRAVFFDLDDTLCSYWEASKAALRETFRTLGPEGVSAEQLYASWAVTFRTFSRELKASPWYETYLKVAEPSRTEQMRRMLEAVGHQDAGLARTLGDCYARLRNEYLRLFPDAMEVLESLRGRYQLGLITNGPADVQRSEIEELQIGHFFEHVLIEGELGYGKPQAEVFARAEVVTACNPDQILFVGNSYAHDILPAIRAGWHTAWVRRATDVPPSAEGLNAVPESLPDEAPEPTYILSSLRQLLALLGN